MIHKCVCASVFQDAAYGLGLRYHNVCIAKSEGVARLRCTVCGTVKEAATPKKKDK